MLKSSEKRLLFLIIAFAFFLRVYKIDSNFNFTGEFGANLLDIKDAFETNSLPIVGPATSHPWLYFGPLYYWIGMLVMRIFGANPLNFACLGVLTGTVIVFLNYLVIKKIFEIKAAFISSFLIAISPLFILFSREARFFFIVSLLFYPLFWSLFKIWKGDKKYFFWTGFSFGVMFSFHYSPIIYIPFIFLIFWLKRSLVKLKEILLFLLGLTIPNIPLLIFDAKQNFTMLSNLILWIPYRILGFFGIYPRNNITFEILGENLNVINQFFGEIFVESTEFWAIISILFVGFLIYKALGFYKSKKISFGWLTIFTLIVFAFVAVFVHGSAPIHYLLPIFPVTPILAALLISHVWKFRVFRFLVTLVLIIFVFTNAADLGRSNKFYGEPKVSLAPHFIPYETQLKVARFIITDANGRKFTLERDGPFDYFDQDYSQNYQYLLWWQGNEAVSDSYLRYRIVEKENEVVIVKEELR